MKGPVLFLLLSILLSGCLDGGYGESSFKKRQNEVQTEKENPETIGAQEMKAHNSTLRHRRDVVESDDLLFSGDSLEIRLVRWKASHAHRVKRLSFTQKSLMWTHRIPYIISFTDTARRMRLRKVLDHIEDKLCVKFIDVEGKRNPSDRSWLTKNGFETNAYIDFITGKGCVARYGIGNGRGAQRVSPCYAYLSMMHETMHALGGLHDQKLPNREKYITVHRNNILVGKLKQYDKSSKPPRVNAAFFDPHSNLLYGNTFFSKDKSSKSTYDFVRPEMGKLDGIRSTKTLVYEMTQNYKCRETFCSGVRKDCGPGFLTFVHDRCVCVCPDQYDPDTNCGTLIDKVVGPKSWPNIPFTLYKADECPDGFSEGTIPITGKKLPEQTGIPLPTEGKTLYIRVCTKATPTENIPWNDWPIGNMCIGKVKGVPCSLPFVRSSFKIKSDKPETLQGSVGDVTVDGKSITINFCCYDGASYQLPARLPTSKPFRLLKTKSGCQEVEGMFPVLTTIKTQTKASVSGFKPGFNSLNSRFTHYSCLYVPPVYGCNEIFRLSSSRRTVTFSIPNKGSLRESNRRCFYAFQAPQKSRLRLTFNKFSIHPEDRLYVKRFHPWTNSFRVMSDSRPTHTITERNYLFVEFWSHYEEDRQYEGVDLTVDLLLDDEMCYNEELQGSDYAGDKTVSELYEECVPWKEAVSCPDFPWRYSLTLLNSENKCRNLDRVEMLQPWCYVKVDAGACVRRYCDVCNEAEPKDVNENCASKIAADPKACKQDTVFRNNCFKSCGVSTAPYDQTKVKCPKPKLPSILKLRRRTKSSYRTGSFLNLYCGRQPIRINCTSHGWGLIDEQLCATNICIDKSLLCPLTLRNFPALCTHEKSKKFAGDFCKRSCGICKQASFLCQAGDACGSTSSRANRLLPFGHQYNFLPLVVVPLVTVTRQWIWRILPKQPSVAVCTYFLVVVFLVLINVLSPYIRIGLTLS